MTTVRQFEKICFFDCALVAHSYHKTQDGSEVAGMPRINHIHSPVSQWDGSLDDLMNVGYEKALEAGQCPRPFKCTACGKEAWTGMAICAYGCQQVFLYHPAAVEVEVEDELAPFCQFNIGAVVDEASDAYWVVQMGHHLEV